MRTTIPLALALALSRAALAAPPPPPSRESPKNIPFASIPQQRAPATAAAPAKPKTRRVKPKKADKPEPPPLPAPEIKLTIDAPAPDSPWTMRAENTGKVPLEILADARLLVLDVTPPDATKPIRCELPRAMRPRGDEDRSLVVPPSRVYAEKLDPRLFCFGARAAAALVPGAKIVPRLVAPRPGPPAVGPIDGLETPIAPESEHVGLEATIGPVPAAQAAPKPAPAPRPLAVSSSTFVDADRGADAVVTVKVTNVSSLPVTFLLRPETLAFDVTGPSGVDVTDPSPTVKCASTGEHPAPIAEVYTTLAPRHHAELSVMLAALCPDHALDHPGMYVVHAKLDTQHDEGATIGLHPFDGEVLAEGTTRLRVQTAPGISRSSTRPHLVEPPAP